MKKPVIKPPRRSARSKRIKLPRLGERRPDFDSLFRSPIDPPFNPDPSLSQGLEADSDEEMSLTLQAIIEERKTKQDDYRLTNDQDYYVLVCFQSEQQKLDFLEKTGWKHLGERFIDGLKLARLLDVDVEAIHLPMREYARPMPVGLRDKEVIR